MVSAYRDSKDTLLRNLSELNAICQGKGFEQLGEELDETIEKLRENRFYLAILGEFKRGKSTLTNSLLGRELLPVAVVPLTSVITMVQYGPELEIKVVFKSQEVNDIGLSQLPLYITEKGNPGNVKGVSHVIISYPAPILAQGVVLVDTPGVGSVYKHNTEVTYAFLPRVDAAFFVLSVDPPLSKTEGEFLSEISQKVPRLFFVLNKIDYLAEKELEEALMFTREILRSYLPDNYPISIYPMSAKMALEASLQGSKTGLERSGFTALQADLFEFLTTERGNTALAAAARRGHDLALEMLSMLQLEERAIKMPAEVLEAKSRVFEEELKTILRNKEDSLHIIRGEMAALVQTIDEDLDALKQQETPLIQSRLLKITESEPNLPPKKLALELEQALITEITRALTNWYQLEEQKIESMFEEIVKRFTEEVNETVRRILELSANLFELGVNGFASVQPLVKESSFYFKFGNDPSLLPMDVVSFSSFLPPSLARQLIIKKFMNKVSEELDRNCGRIRWDYLQRKDKSLLLFTSTYEDKVNAVIGGIRRALDLATSQRRQTESEVRKSLAVLGEQLDRVKEKLNLFAQFLAAQQSLPVKESQDQTYELA